MNSNWQIHRIGLLNFWYYDEEEFYFADGRMLLRGANGSGKSVTMQSFIPLLLDGNMRPERLDPFGSRARRMENYLLEEGDGREERTGYLYMEFKRTDSETYITIGIGMRARRGKSMDTWYFFLQDNRRIGKEFYLYRQEAQKIPLTQRELKNRLGEGGQVVESQKEYMGLVNKLIFGFETDDAYKELVDLLIQLRTPKLSKDFKPSIINDILTNSLMPLSEDDLRPMSEAIENMDSLKASLDDLKETQQAAAKIARSYHKYNRFIAFDKARKYKQYSQRLQQGERELANLENLIDEKNKEKDAYANKDMQLSQELVLREEELASYGENDLVKLDKERQSLLTDQETIEKEIALKETTHSGKKAQRQELEHRQTEKRGDVEALEDEIHKLLDEMRDELTQATFDDYEFMANELQEHLSETYSFASHRELLDRQITNLQLVKDKLKEELQLRKNSDFIESEVEKKRRERDTLERSERDLEDQLRTVKNELLEKINLWEQEAQEIVVPEEKMHTLLTKIEGFTYEQDYHEVKNIIQPFYQEAEKDLQLEKAHLTFEKDQNRKLLEKTEQELTLWRERTDPVPERSPEQVASREHLRQAGIAYQEFYKVLDFPTDFSEQQRNRLEEALLRMGILDAVLIDTEDFEKVKAFEGGLSDRYILTNTKKADNNLESLVEIVNEDNDILLYQKVAKALAAIGYDDQGEVTVKSEGYYQLGPITGTLTGEYQARFIGERARKRYQEAKIAELTVELEQLIKDREELERKEIGLQKRIEALGQCWAEFPKGDDLLLALRTLEDAKYALRQVKQALDKEQERLNEVLRNIDGLHLEIQNLCTKVYTVPNLEVVSEVLEELLSYKKLLQELEISHSKYISICEIVATMVIQLESLDEDIDTVLVDIRNLEIRRQKLRERLEAISEQLAIGDVEEVLKKIELVNVRLKEIPIEQRGIASKLGTLGQQITQAISDKENSLVDTLRLRNQVKVIADALKQELFLGYLKEDLAGDIAEGMDDISQVAEEIVRREGALLEQEESEKVSRNLQESFFNNRAALTEYGPSLQEIFSEKTSCDGQEFSFARVEINVRYRGQQVKFPSFAKRVDEDIEEKKGLLSDKERELFEDILLGVINRKIRAKIYSSESWVKNMNELMESMRTSSGIRLSLRWRSKSAEQEGQLDTKELVTLLKKDQKWMKEEESEKLLSHFRSKIEAARKILEESGGIRSFHGIVRDILDYRQWFEFRLEYEKIGERKKELTDRDFFTFSGGEKAMAMYVPLFSAVVAKYEAARDDAPRLISLDEAFAGVDATNINDMFRLMVDFRFAFIINSQILWGDYETVPSLAIYQLLRADNAKFVTVIRYTWNGKEKMLEG
ncbi:TIGR02680 family protein [Ohessyouella blattaphilus]|uniref:TIGR02680 family protein n=1 Tax=Ohessyouella blattaphilus TaxID=2949333 RepID=A0ABT1EFX0_9FIRM|nr:TIGR02680 family protein [Ohessyouella blattaphilus]MCP1109578.1 TIGR02680 family protein [Ohessyouella blattaphilus]MCR8562972.1 TIGR02680 family protein [Ohessyouella blattaphilus]MDL2250583.1 TIGR02680 family protein [Lachnospiraceae bacterium OttesenSCG-928-J05]